MSLRPALHTLQTWLGMDFRGHACVYSLRPCSPSSLPLQSCEDICHCALVSQTFHDVIDDESFWMRLCSRDFPDKFPRLKKLRLTVCVSVLSCSLWFSVMPLPASFYWPLSCPLKKMPVLIMGAGLVPCISRILVCQGHPKGNPENLG